MIQTATPQDSATYALVHAILTLVRERTGCDFSHYRHATIYRRIQNRMISIGIGSLDAYLTLLEKNEDETPRLVERLTIKVSRFYRNSATFDLLRTQLIPQLAMRRGAKPLRLWSAGCGCGEEAYTLAMLLDEAGIDGIVEASDIDPHALRMASAGVYASEAFSEMPSTLRERYVEPVRVGSNERHGIRQALKERVRFSQHDLISGAPAPGTGIFDLVCCRNVLIYLQREIQECVLADMHKAIEPGGILCLGEAEWPSTLASSLEPIGQRTHCFRVKTKTSAATDVADTAWRHYLAPARTVVETKK